MAGETRRQRDARLKREAVLRSHGFQEWYAARRLLHPVPADPYRAYMIDIVLRAKVAPKGVWKQATMWFDVPEIDYPSHMPAPKPRRGRPSIVPFIPAVRAARHFLPRPLKPEELKLKKEAEEIKRRFIEKYHLPDVELVLEPSMSQQYSSYFRGFIGSGGKPYAKIGIAHLHKTKASVLSALTHELGHHAFYYQGERETGHVTSAAYGAGQIEHERKAWELAKPFMVFRKPVQAWDKKYSLGTYLRTSPRKREMTPLERRKSTWEERMRGQRLKITG